MAGLRPQSGAELAGVPPPGFKPIPKPSDFLVPSNAVGKQSSPEKGSHEQPAVSHQGENGNGGTTRNENGLKNLRGTRKRVRPQFLDPSPKPFRSCTKPTSKRCRGRPPAAGLKKRTQQIIEVEDESKVSLAPSRSLWKQANAGIPPGVLTVENQNSPFTSNQSIEQKSHTGILPSTCQHTNQNPNMKLQTQDFAVEGQRNASWCEKKPTTLSLLQVPEIANGSLNGQANEVSHGMREIVYKADPLMAQEDCYTVNPSLLPIFQAIISKHGDITKNCPLHSSFMRTSVLEGICKVVQELQRKELMELDNGQLYSYYEAVKDALTMNVNVSWLLLRLDQIHDAVKSFAEIKKLVDEKTLRIKRIEQMKKDLECQKAELERLKSAMEADELGFNVKWLLEPLDEVLETIGLMKKLKGLSDDRKCNNKLTRVLHSFNSSEEREKREKGAPKP
ncbi:hypothetical protein RJ640_018899 [Escallonia rubra]|uniref:Uncharacterized protein n=1 Tax=Escallonia rubra TaxID=112253 RepID=A0AA88SFM7_9ASTE|nr:hypothetical protein RJ640_018899 [Escallonia rubra]